MFLQFLEGSSNFDDLLNLHLFSVIWQEILEITVASIVQCYFRTSRDCHLHFLYGCKNKEYILIERKLIHAATYWYKSTSFNPISHYWKTPVIGKRRYGYIWLEKSDNEWMFSDMNGRRKTVISNTVKDFSLLN